MFFHSSSSNAAAGSHRHRRCFLFRLPLLLPVSPPPLLIRDIASLLLLRVHTSAAMVDILLYKVRCQIKILLGDFWLCTSITIFNEKTI
ncbi:hypothetical protein PIB30_015466 [Stylosanthes scabra]|uniref:Uncharacterized protein n=1 Tax=Stylosanthes scabra TaxID=79078 RepID=A0ABU6V9C9_9FABA|nr:hypothetical protein [Stylosanthes scabra]